MFPIALLHKVFATRVIPRQLWPNARNDKRFI